MILRGVDAQNKPAVVFLPSDHTISAGGGAYVTLRTLQFMKIRSADTPASIAQWMALPDRLYSNESNYIPHLRQDIEKIFDPKRNKFFREGACRRWILVRDEEVIGRIAAFHWKKYSSGFSQPTGGIGFFECIHDRAAAHMLFDAAVHWLREEGLEAVDAPINFGEKDAYWGLVVENFTDMHSYRMNFNLPYYRDLFESYGFREYFQQWCFRRDLYVPAQEVFVRKNAMLHGESGFRVANVRGLTDEQIAEQFLTVYNHAWGGHSGFKKMQLQQARNIVKAMKPVMDKDIVLFAYHHDRPIGFYISLPELNEIFRHVHGNLNAWGKIKFLFYKYFGKRHTMVGIIFGVDREYQGRGIEAALIKHTEEHIVTLNRYQETIMTWIGDFNPKMVRVIENLGASRYRTLITYRKLFDPNAPFERCPIVD
jgi:GNAT superfamily N-acetyltransferase